MKALIFIFISLSLAAQELSVEEKVGQLLLVHFHGKVANENADLMLRKAHVGGFIYYGWANELSSPDQVRSLSMSLQAMNQSNLPLLIAIDQEGGKVNRLQNGFTEFPSQQVIASMGIEDLERQVAFSIGRELTAVGINMNLAPDVDVNCNPQNPIIGSRAFGADPEVVSKFGKAAIQGYNQAQILCALKHFPGHGDVSLDSHAGTPVVSKDLSALNHCELIPFLRLAKDADAIMTAHILVPALDPHHPATFSKTILQDLLRTQIGFQGVIMCDSLVMRGITDHASSIAEAAILAFNAGCDILCLGGKLLHESTQDELTPQDVLNIHSALVEAVKTGRIDPQRLDASVKRIIRLKNKYTTTEQILFLAQVQEKLTPENAKLIGEKIWKNECNQTIKGLAHWHPNEEFPSLGIAHFIWYPENTTGPFDEAFSQYLAYLKESQVKMPDWLAEANGAPWPNREAFNASSQVEELRTWLAETIDWQIRFLLKRSLNSLARILHEDPTLLPLLKKLMTSPDGLYAVIDYLNFKGEGLSPKEKYQGEGWGLYQVLKKIGSQATIEKFQNAAIETLSIRVANAPKERGENRFLPGWKNRIATYKFK